MTFRLKVAKQSRPVFTRSALRAPACRADLSSVLEETLLAGSSSCSICLGLRNSSRGRLAVGLKKRYLYYQNSRRPAAGGGMVANQLGRTVVGISSQNRPRWTWRYSRTLFIGFSPEWGGTTGARRRRDFRSRPNSMVFREKSDLQHLSQVGISRLAAASSRAYVHLRRNLRRRPKSHLRLGTVTSGILADLRLPQVEKMEKNKKIIYSWSLVVTLWRAPRARVHRCLGS